MVEDVLIKVREFIYPVDFVVLEAEVVVSPENEISVILVDHSLVLVMLSLIVRMVR